MHHKVKFIYELMLLDPIEGHIFFYFDEGEAISYAYSHGKQTIETTTSDKIAKLVLKNMI